MAATRRKQDDRHLEILRELIAAGENRYCLDCGTRGPTYVNTTIGSFVCSKCSGMLRGLTPPHRVKSISMATFTSEEMDLIKSRGNDYCRRVWLGLYEGENANAKDEQSIRDFMADKYEKKRYYLSSEVAPHNGNTKPKQNNNNVAAAPLISITQQPPKPPAHLARSVNSQIPPVNSSNFVPRPVNNFIQPVCNASAAAAVTTQVPEFAVDFSTANIYNSSEHNNNKTMPSANNTMTRPAFASPPHPANDRYAALADLDIELRQQKCLSTMAQDTSTVNRNPFQTSSSDLFGNKNPFSNGAWRPEPAPIAFNPFTPSANINGFSNSKNPFL